MGEDHLSLDPFELMGRLFKKENRSNSRVYEVIKVAGPYVKLGKTEKHPRGAKRDDYPKWRDYTHLIEVKSED